MLPGIVTLNVEKLPIPWYYQWSVSRKRFGRELGIIIEIYMGKSVSLQTEAVTKTFKKLHTCINPKPLNKALRRRHFAWTVLLTFCLSFRTWYFKKADLTISVWHFELHKASIYSTMPDTACCCYPGNRLRFGLKGIHWDFSDFPNHGRLPRGASYGKWHWYSGE